MTQDDQRVRDTVQAELRRRRGMLDKSEDHAGPVSGDRHRVARPEGNGGMDPR